MQSKIFVMLGEEVPFMRYLFFMESVVERARTQNSVSLRVFERHLAEITGLIHFGVVAPLMENFFYALALFRKKEQKTMLEGKELVLRLCAYQTVRGFFPDAIHLFAHDGASWRKNLYILATLQTILHEFGRVIDKESKARMQDAIRILEKAFETVILPESLGFLRDALLRKETAIATPQDLSMVTDLIVAYPFLKEAMQPEATKLLEAVLYAPLKLYQGPFQGLEQWHGKTVGSLLEFSVFSVEVLKEGDFFSDAICMAGVLAPDLSFLQGQAPWLRQRIDPIEGIVVMRAFLGNNGATAALISAHPVTFDPTRSCYRIELEGLYEEDAHEIALYVTLDPTIIANVEGKTATLFRENETVTLITPERVIPIRFRSVNGEGNFIGHISLDAKPYEKEKGGLYDRKISIRTVERPVSCVLELFIGIND